MDWHWITTTWSAAAMSVVSVLGMYLALVAYTRIAGLRSFSKMSSFDFAVTVAVGSVLATTVLSPEPPLVQAAVALGALYLVQIGVAHLRTVVPTVRRLVDNRPVLLMDTSGMHPEVMRREGVTRADVLSKLREANVLRLEQVHAVVLESTGDISVLHGDGDAPVEAVLFEGVRGADDRGAQEPAR